MKKLIKELYKRIPVEVSQLFSSQRDNILVYHNIGHTLLVVERALEIADACNIDHRDRFLLFAASWFHDVGQLYAPPALHERESVLRMCRCLRDSLSRTELRTIARCILATRMPHRPSTLLQQVICDADTYHLGTPDFMDTDERVRRELLARGFDIGRNWDHSSLRFLRSHQFFTAYCRELLEPGKLNNIRILEERLRQAI